MSRGWTRRAWMAAAAGGLAGCAAPRVLEPLIPPAGFAGPALESAAFVVQDGARLPYLRWGPEAADLVLVALHGINDHKMAFHLAGPWWAARGVATYAYDQRGFGSAPGRGLWPGERLMVEDLRTVVALIRARHPTARIGVVGESMGGAVAICAFASAVIPAADAAILLAPAVWGWSSQPLANRLALRAAARLAGAWAVEPPRFVTGAIRATDNIDELIRMGGDPEYIRATRFDVVHGLVDLMEQASQALGRMKVPTLLMYGAHDQLVERAPMRRALERAGTAGGLRTAFYADGWHLLNRDLGAAAVYADALAWLENPAAALPSGAPPALPALAG